MKRGFSAPFGGTATKAERLLNREFRHEAKALRKAARQAEHAARRAAGLRGAPIEALPDDYQGLARTISYGDEART